MYSGPSPKSFRLKQGSACNNLHTKIGSHHVPSRVGESKQMIFWSVVTPPVTDLQIFILSQRALCISVRYYYEKQCFRNKIGIKNEIYTNVDKLKHIFGNRFSIRNIYNKLFCNARFYYVTQGLHYTPPHTHTNIEKKKEKTSQFKIMAFTQKSHNFHPHR